MYGTISNFHVCVIFCSRNLNKSSISQENGRAGAIGLCIENLPYEMKCYYQDFALFVEDVNIKIEVKSLFFNLYTFCLLSLTCNFQTLLAGLNFELDLKLFYI
jgi:hypothetical protein